MPRLGKKTLYLDLDALEVMEAALNRFPGRPSVSSFLSEQLPLMADSLTKMADAMEANGLRGMADLLGIAADVEDMTKELQEDVKETLKTTKKADTPLSELAKDVPPKKPRKTPAKKVVKP